MVFAFAGVPLFNHNKLQFPEADVGLVDQHPKCKFCLGKVFMVSLFATPTKIYICISLKNSVSAEFSHVYF